MFDHLLESSHRDDSNKWSKTGFSEETMNVESIEVDFTHIWSSGSTIPSQGVDNVSQAHPRRRLCQMYIYR